MVAIVGLQEKLLLLHLLTVAEVAALAVEVLLVLLVVDLILVFMGWAVLLLLPNVRLLIEAVVVVVLLILFVTLYLAEVLNAAEALGVEFMLGRVLQ
jgi:hypothetical protein